MSRAKTKEPIRLIQISERWVKISAKERAGR
jgi:hypothetical protein